MAYSTIRKGSNHADVKTWQDYLKGQGYNISASGTFDDATLDATKKYQASMGLTTDGIVGKNTWASMNTGNNTTNTANTKNIPEIFGADASLVEQANSSFSGSDELKEKESNKNTYADKYLDYTSNTNIVDENTKNLMNGKLEDYLSPEIAQADTYIKEQLAQIQSGKTSWSDQLSGAINDYLNRDKFEYDVDNDQLFQQALASAMNSGKTAMQDTIGQASALTGGYGSTYATSVGNQAYNSFIEDAYNNLPEYYQMALEAYQAEGQEMLNRVNILGSADDREYGRMVDAYNLTSDYRNNLWNEGFNEWTTTTSNAINYGNFLLNENQTIANNLKGAYDISANEYELKYTQEYNDWYSSVENAWKTIGLQNSDAWANKNYEQTERWNQKDLDYKYANLDFEKEQFNYSKGDTNNDGKVDDEEKAALNQNIDDIPKEISTKASKYKTNEELASYLDAQEAAGLITAEESEYLYGVYHSPEAKKNVNISTGALGNNFKVNKGDNFDVYVDGEPYRVENHGKVTNTKTVENLDKEGASDKSIFLYNGNAYVKWSNNYYKVGATSIIGIKTKGYENLVKALS